MLKEDASPSRLASEETYNSEGTEMLSSTGPEHMVMLDNGETAPARKVLKLSYGEGAPSEGGPYPLVTTQTTAAADMAKGGEEQDARTTITSFAGQEGLGWKLRKPTSVSAIAGLRQPHAHDAL